MSMIDIHLEGMKYARSVSNKSTEQRKIANAYVCGYRVAQSEALAIKYEKQ